MITFMRHKDALPNIFSVLEKCIGGKNQADIARRAGVSTGTISRIVNKGQDDIKLSSFLGLIDALGIGLRDVFGEAVPSEHDYDFVPKAKAKLGAGYSLEVSSEVESLLAFRKDFLLRIGNSSRLVLFDVRGRSMEPTIFENDTVLLNTAETEVVSGKVYGIRIEDELCVKRLRREPGVIVVSSDNREEGEFKINIADDHHGFAVIGRVRWIGRVVS